MDSHLSVVPDIEEEDEEQTVISPEESDEACFKCGMSLELFASDEFMRQPYGALEFSTAGHYGSMFDPFDQERLTVLICDDCLVGAPAGTVIYYKRAPVTRTRLEKVQQAQLPWENKNE